MQEPVCPRWHVACAVARRWMRRSREAGTDGRPARGRMRGAQRRVRAASAPRSDAPFRRPATTTTLPDLPEPLPSAGSLTTCGGSISRTPVTCHSGADIRGNVGARSSLHHNPPPEVGHGRARATATTASVEAVHLGRRRVRGRTCHRRYLCGMRAAGDVVRRMLFLGVMR